MNKIKSNTRKILIRSKKTFNPLMTLKVKVEEVEQTMMYLIIV